MATKKKTTPNKALKRQITRMQDEFFGGGVRGKPKKSTTTRKKSKPAKQNVKTTVRYSRGKQGQLITHTTKNVIPKKKK